ncbi:MAG: hypothetical protein KVP17_003794 [Porospora cf. gigantea B]|uniref:uncharacterized protein n=1 Tax=Porospora cf. gigantea B TaxID=2853592 RepID=UPI0035717DB7|nr:MAG: hypothetical protein KVP17_003794 [Porospora cf. gigantea B]
MEALELQAADGSRFFIAGSEAYSDVRRREMEDFVQDHAVPTHLVRNVAVDAFRRRKLDWSAGILESCFAGRLQKTVGESAFDLGCLLCHVLLWTAAHTDEERRQSIHAQLDGHVTALNRQAGPSRRTAIWCLKTLKSIATVPFTADSSRAVQNLKTTATLCRNLTQNKDPSSLVGLTTLAAAELHMRNPGRALQLLGEALRLRPSVSLRFAMGVCFSRLGQLAKAKLAFGRVLALQADHVGALLGWLLVERLELIGNATQRCYTEVSVDPKASWEGLAPLESTYMADLARLDRTNPVLGLLLGQDALCAGNLDLVDRVLSSVSWDHHSYGVQSEVEYIRGQAAHCRNQFAQAAEAYSHVIALKPTHIGGRVGLLQCLLALEGQQDLEPHVVTLLKAAPRNYEVLKLASMTYLRLAFQSSSKQAGFTHLHTSLKHLLALFEHTTPTEDGDLYGLLVTVVSSLLQTLPGCDVSADLSGVKPILDRHFDKIIQLCPAPLVNNMGVFYMCVGDWGHASTAFKTLDDSELSEQQKHVVLLNSAFQEVRSGDLYAGSRRLKSLITSPHVGTDAALRRSKLQIEQQDLLSSRKTLGSLAEKLTKAMRRTSQPESQLVLDFVRATTLYSQVCCLVGKTHRGATQAKVALNHTVVLETAKSDERVLRALNELRLFTASVTAAKGGTGNVIKSGQLISECIDGSGRNITAVLAIGCLLGELGHQRPALEMFRLQDTQLSKHEPRNFGHYNHRRTKEVAFLSHYNSGLLMASAAFGKAVGNLSLSTQTDVGSTLKPEDATVVNKAITHLQASLRLRPWDKETWCQLARVQIDGHHHRAAVSTCELARKRWPTDVRLEHNLAVSLEHLIYSIMNDESLKETPTNVKDCIRMSQHIGEIHRLHAELKDRVLYDGDAEVEADLISQARCSALPIQDLQGVFRVDNGAITVPPPGFEWLPKASDLRAACKGIYDTVIMSLRETLPQVEASWHQSQRLHDEKRIQNEAARERWKQDQQKRLHEKESEDRRRRDVAEQLEKEQEEISMSIPTGVSRPTSKGSRQKDDFIDDSTHGQSEVIDTLPNSDEERKWAASDRKRRKREETVEERQQRKRRKREKKERKQRKRMTKAQQKSTDE